MLEVKNLVKVYKTKGGVETKALDGVSVNFPETGLVFLLGKSGSGKSTLLNMIGGLDRPDKGEIIVKGRSSKDFSQADFDSYRNTFIGFIFQEYNVLNEFNIEQNIALALQLQGKKNDKEAVNKLLKEVDLEGFNRRKPNTLSGGQKQRIAIARALIKQPEIIMADEPTGALDSVTGKQVLETLKKLSKTKLVIIVSHDQDFAEEYGDRIIELKDGKIISDKSKELVPPKAINEKMQIINGNIIDIKKGSALTEADFKQLYQMIKKQDKEVLISTGEDNIKITKKAARISSDGKGERFADTKEVALKKYDGKQTKFIRSHMPFSRSFKMGVSSLKTKPVRLIFTILLSVVSFTMFGVSSALMLYDPNYSLSVAMEKSDRTSEAVAKLYKVKRHNVQIDGKTGEILQENDTYEDDRIGYVGVQELKDLNARNSNRFIGVFNFSNNESNISNDNTDAFKFKEVQVSGEAAKYYKYNYFHGLSDADASFFTAHNYGLTGAHPTKENEVAISNYHYELLKASGTYTGVSNPNDIVGKKLSLQIRQKHYSFKNIELTITGVYDFGAIPEAYAALKEELPASMSKNQQDTLLTNYAITMANSFYTVGYVAPSFYEKYGFIETRSDSYLYPLNLRGYEYSSYERENWDVSQDNGNAVYAYEDLKNASGVTYYNTDFEEVNNPIDINDNEVLLPYDQYYSNEIYFKYYESINRSRNTLSNIEGDSYYQPLTDFLDDSSSETPTSELAITYKRLTNNYEEWQKSGAYPEGHDIVADVTAIKAGFNELYSKAMRNYYLLRICDTIDNYSLATTDFDTNVRPYYEEMRSPAGISEEHVALYKTALQEFLDSDASLSWLTKYQVGESIQRGLDNDYFGMIINQKAMSLYGDGVDFYSLRNDYVNDRSNPEAEARYTAILDFIQTDILGKESASYEYNPEFMVLKPYRNVWNSPDYYSKDYTGKVKHHTVKGYFSTGDDYSNFPAVTRASVEKYIENDREGDYWTTINETNYVSPEDAKYAYVLTATNYSKSDISLFFATGDNFSYTMTNGTYLKLKMFTDTISMLKTIFLIVGGVTGGLAALLLLNFISVSISSKNKDIGILRAVGARGSDVFKIFFSESSVIAIICFVLSAVAAGITCYYINGSIRDLLSIGLLDYGVINVLLILGVAVVISFIATIIPVSIASKKPPVEAIRSL